MPGRKESQRQWEMYVERVLYLSHKFPRASHEDLIESLTSRHVADDERIIGWSDLVRELRAKGTSPTLHEFVEYVRKVNLAASTTRHAAHDELLALGNSWSTLADAGALALRIQQLYRQLFPAHSDETEPISRLNACILIFDLLQKLKTSSAKHDIVWAWRDETTFSASVAYKEFLVRDLHASDASSRDRADAFIKDVVTKLQDAHRMRVETKPQVTRAVSNLTPRQHIAQAAQHFGVTPRVLAAAVTTHASQSGDRDRTVASVPASLSYRERDRPQHSRTSAGNVSNLVSRGRAPPGIRGRGRAPRGVAPVQRSAAPAMPLPPLPVPEDPASATSRVRALLGSPHFAWYPGKHLDAPRFGSKQAKIDRALAGACLCCSEAGHPFARCPEFVGLEPGLKQEYLLFKRAFTEMKPTPPAPVFTAAQSTAPRPSESAASVGAASGTVQQPQHR